MLAIRTIGNSVNSTLPMPVIQAIGNADIANKILTADCRGITEVYACSRPE